MPYAIDAQELQTWCRVPSTELSSHPDRKIDKVVIRKTPAEIMDYIGNLMAEEIIENNKKKMQTKWVLPAGPRQQYETFIKRVVDEKISLKNLYAFHMDEWLDRNTRPFPYGKTHNCLRGIMDDMFYSRIPDELNVPLEQRIWPKLEDMDYLDNKVAQVGGIDTVWAGIGYKGLVAFNESPRDTYGRITLDEYAESKTRIVKISDETIIAQSHRKWGGCPDLVPPFALTIGFKSMLTAKRVVFMIATGAWKQTVVRVLLFSDATLEYPATLFTQRVPECILAVDEFTSKHPLENYSKSMLNEGW
ncbi:MAG: glucosamine-6-phosphate isomerase [Oscillospiraceae bacterium]